MFERTAFARQVGQLLDDHLAGQEATRGAVSKLAVGAAFETWLSFETRLLLEANRTVLGLATKYEHDNSLYKYWISNEYKKVDLGIGDIGSEDWLVAFEFKLIHNNKNWITQCNRIRYDLFPAEGTPKADIKLQLGRMAIVGVVGKVYTDHGGSYPGQIADIKKWEQEKLWPRLMSKEGSESKYVEHVWPDELWPGQLHPNRPAWLGRRFLLRGEDWLVSPDQVPHFFQLHILAPSAPSDDPCTEA